LGQAEIRRRVDFAGLCEENLASNGEVEVVVGLMERCVTENARVALDQDEYTQRYNGLVSRYEAVRHSSMRLPRWSLTKPTAKSCWSSSSTQ